MSILPQINALEIKDVCLSIDGHTILDHIQCTIPEGRYVGIVGPNGGGKTTLLKIIVGLLTPTSGEVKIFGQSPSEARKHGAIGYVPQRIAQSDISFPVSVEELIWSGRVTSLGIGRWRRDADRVIVEQSMERTNVSHLRHRLVSTLSGGERQRVFIARALTSNPRLLLLDEPTTGVDLSSKNEFYTLLQSLNKELGLTILFISHDIEVITSEVAFILALNQKLLCHCESHLFLSEETMRSLYGNNANAHLPHTHL